MSRKPQKKDAREQSTRQLMGIDDITDYPEKAEPVHSILAALKRFQEAPPALKKDKAGPSHEER